MANGLLFAATVLIWGSTWIAISFQLGEVAILVSVFYRFLLAGVVYMGVLILTRRLVVPRTRDHLWIMMQALCLFSLNFLCFYAAAQYIPSGLISVIFSLATLFNAINARIFFKDRITARAIVASGFGAAGLVLLFGRELAVSHPAGVLSGVLMACLGTLFFSWGNMISRRNTAQGVTPATTASWGMCYGAAILAAVIVVTGTPVTLPVSPSYWVALLYLSLIGSVVGFTAYLSLIARIGSARAAYSTVLFPVVALGLSTVFEGYQWHWTGALGLAFALIGNLIMFMPRLPGKGRSALTTG